MNFNQLLDTRRSVYMLKNTSKINDNDLLNLLYENLKKAPSAFNTQPVFAVIASKEQHKFVWDSVSNALEKILSTEQFKKTKAKLKVFENAYGTILLFKNTNDIEDIKKAYPGFANRQDFWGEQSFGIAAYTIWLTLADLGLGANMQHYDPLLDAAIEKEFKIPKGYVLEAEIVYGDIAINAEAKESKSQEELIKIAK